MIKCTFESGKVADPPLRHVVADVLLVRPGEILLGMRHESLIEGGKWAIIGGYLDFNESGADAAIREVKEETGYEAHNLQLFYLNDKPLRRKDSRHTVSLVYIAEAGEKTGEADWENKQQQWFKLDALPASEQIAFDHAELLELYRKHLSAPLQLPVLYNRG
jgi:ADP-ribose pyrophosphatase YjhB (NUDIX family)